MELSDINLQTHIRKHTGVDFDKLPYVRGYVVFLLRHVHGVPVPEHLRWNQSQAQNGAYGFELVSEIFPAEYPDACIRIRGQSTQPHYAWWYYPEWSRRQGTMHEIFHGTL